MSVQWRITIAGLVLVSITEITLQALAQMPTPTQSGPSSAPSTTLPRVEVNPRPLLYRRCASWYVLQNRPSGQVLFPEQHCWWVRG